MEGKPQAHGTIKTDSITSDEWNFNVGDGAELFQRLRGMKWNLGNIADIFVGLQTSADDVFIMELIRQTKHTVHLYSSALDNERAFEKGLFFPLVSGTDVNRYAPLPERQYILFPYRVDENVTLLPYSEIASQYPLTAKYLEENRKRLEERESGKFKDKEWYRFGRNQNIGIQGQIKLCVPRLVDKLYATYDHDGKHFLDNVDVGGITLKEEFQNQGLLYLLGLLNSRLLRWYFPSVSAPFRGGWLSANRQFLSQLPIRVIDFTKPNDKAQHSKIVALVERMLRLHKENQAAKNDYERERLKREINLTDERIDARVYELYELDQGEIDTVKAAT